jgi:hypothetical protein
MQRQIVHLIPFPFHSEMDHPLLLMDVAHFQHAEFLTVQPVIEQCG